MLPQKLCPNISSHGCISLQETCIATCLITVKSDSILPCKCASVLCDDVPETLGGSSHFSTAPEHSLVACFPLAPFAEPLNSRVVLAVAAYYTRTCVTGAAGLEEGDAWRAGPVAAAAADATTRAQPRHSQPSRQTQQSAAAAAAAARAAPASLASPSDSTNVKRGAGSTRLRQSEQFSHCCMPHPTTLPSTCSPLVH